MTCAVRLRRLLFSVSYLRSFPIVGSYARLVGRNIYFLRNWGGRFWMGYGLRHVGCEAAVCYAGIVFISDIALYF